MRLPNEDNDSTKNFKNAFRNVERQLTVYMAAEDSLLLFCNTAHKNRFSTLKRKIANKLAKIIVVNGK